MPDKTRIICTFKPNRMEKVRAQVEVAKKFNAVSQADIDTALQKRHAKFFRLAHDRYQWEVR